MIRLSEKLLIGDSADEYHADIEDGIVGILNVAHDLTPTKGWWNGLAYAQVGLVDGPGNALYLYVTAVLTLHMLMQKGPVLVCCHSGTRSLVVALMYTNVFARRGYDGCLDILSERVDIVLPVPSEAHRQMFDQIHWAYLARIMEN